MRHTHLWAAAAILASIILASFVFLVPHTHDGVSTTLLPTTVPSVPTVALRDVFKKGIHIITGSLETPNVCTGVTVDATLTGTASSTQNILLAISMPNDSGICLQEKSTTQFSTTITAPQDSSLVVTVNGISATTTNL